jgi:mannose-6-phosphate isomerase-like protein (cupin superfamily)
MGLDEPVYRDSRGEIHRHDVAGVKFNVLVTKAGVLRSGDYHPNKQFDLVLSGKMEITLRQNEEDKVIVKGPNEFIEIPPNTPHLFKSLTDTVMLEWWDGPFEATYYEPYRKQVEEQLNRMNN